MKSFQVQTYYELLEISVSASALEVRGAFERLTRLFDDDQVALYGLIDADRSAALRERLQQALETLCDDEARAVYDATLGLPPREPASRRSGPGSPPITSGPHSSPPPQRSPAPAPSRPAPIEAPMVPLEHRDEPSRSSTFGWGGGYAYVTAPAPAPAPAPSTPVGLLVALEEEPAPSPMAAPTGSPPPTSAPEVEASPAATAPTLTDAPVLAASTLEAEPAAAGEAFVDQRASVVASNEVGGVPEPVPVPSLSTRADVAPSPGPAHTPEHGASVPVMAPERSDPSVGASRWLEEEPLAIVPARATPIRELRAEKVAPFEVPAGVEINGDLLRQVRMARGLSMVQLAERTRIGVRHLENVEADRYDVLPATVYLRGILMNLARELGLDGLRVSKSYLTFVDAHRSKG